MNINIRFLLTRLAIGNNQPGFIPEIERRIVKIYIIYIEINSDSIIQTISRALIKKILKN